MSVPSISRRATSSSGSLPANAPIGPQHSGRVSPLGGGRAVSVVAASLLLIGLGCTTLTCWLIQRNIHTVEQARFEYLAERVKNETERRLRTYSYGLRGARGLFNANQDITRGEFRDYVASRDMPQEFPGVLGFGYVERVPRERLSAFIAAEQADNAPEFAVRTSGDLPDLYVTTYIEPLEANRDAQGYDIASDPVRREAADRAMLSGESTITGKVSLIQDHQSRTGFLSFLPVYQSGTHPTSPEERRRDLRGWVEAPMEIEDALRDVTAAADGRVALGIYDGREMTTTALLYTESGTPSGAPGPAAAADQSPPSSVQRAMVNVGGRDWTLFFRSTPRFDAGTDHTTPLVAGACGTVISILLLTPAQICDEVSWRGLCGVADWVHEQVQSTDGRQAA